MTKAQARMMKQAALRRSGSGYHGMKSIRTLRRKQKQEIAKEKEQINE